MFDALFRLCSDPDANVQNATAFLDRLVKVGSGFTAFSTEWGSVWYVAPVHKRVSGMQPAVSYPHQPGYTLAPAASHSFAPRPTPQDIVAESHEFDVGGFIPTLQESLEVSNPFKRQFLLGWLA